VGDWNCWWTRTGSHAPESVRLATRRPAGPLTRGQAPTLAACRWSACIRRNGFHDAGFSMRSSGRSFRHLTLRGSFRYRPFR
jgi:hypothetical protein